MSSYDNYHKYASYASMYGATPELVKQMLGKAGIYDAIQGQPSSAGYSSAQARPLPHVVQESRDALKAYLNPLPKEEEVALTKEQKPQGWKAGLVVVAAAIIAWNLWKNRDEIFVKLEAMASDLGNKLGIGDIPGLTTPKDDKK